MTLSGLMKTKKLEVRLSDRRMNKLRLYAASKDKSMTAVIEDFIDSLSSEEIDKSLDALKARDIY